MRFRHREERVGRGATLLHARLMNCLCRSCSCWAPYGWWVMYLLHFLDFFFYFFGSLGVEFFFIGGKLAQQSQKFSDVYKFLVRYFLEHLHGELVVGGLGELRVQLSRFVLCGHHETNCSDKLLIRELPVVCQP